MAPTLEPWTDFNVAMVGATAALAGLLIVAMSVNIREIMSSRALPARAGASVATLVLALVACAVGLVPGQSAIAYGIELLVATVVAAGFQVAAVRAILVEGYGSPVARTLRGVVGMLPVAAFALGAVLVLVGAGSTDADASTIAVGLAVVAFGALLAIVVAIVMAWVVLVEVLR
ncbi:hypothetical protein [Agromyces sp. ZXT2-3]|uniref:hypothetical protein n=1 Tax=Agromyces sp. ZXT2-3 TaxID=3461152 RepID=UPI004054F366